MSPLKAATKRQRLDKVFNEVARLGNNNKTTMLVRLTHKVKRKAKTVVELRKLSIKEKNSFGAQIALKKEKQKKKERNLRNELKRYKSLAHAMEKKIQQQEECNVYIYE